MPVNTLICDWNGTLIGFSSEKPLFNAIGREIFKSAIPFGLSKIIRMRKSKQRMDALNEQWMREKDLDLIREIFQTFNDNFVKGMPLGHILSLIDKYASSEIVQNNLEKGLLNIVKELSSQGKYTGIFTAACTYPVEKVLRVADYHKYFNFIEADEIYHQDGKTVGFGLNIYGRKPLLMAELVKKRTIDPAGLAYIADTMDEAGCFEIAGYPIVSLLASDEVKNRMAREYKAFVPENMNDLERYLKGI
jgi:phosphoserine phosphatase